MRFFLSIDVYQPYHKAYRTYDDGIPEAIEIPGAFTSVFCPGGQVSGHGWQQSAKYAIAYMVGQLHGRVPDLYREQLYKEGCDWSINYSHKDHLDKNHQYQEPFVGTVEQYGFGDLWFCRRRVFISVYAVCAVIGVDGAVSVVVYDFSGISAAPGI